MAGNVDVVTGDQIKTAEQLCVPYEIKEGRQGLIATPAQGKTTSGGEHQLEITSTRERAMGSMTQPRNGKSRF
jgi:hypothetical protein